jgi:peptide/nickel transport system substrate-binding protein
MSLVFLPLFIMDEEGHPQPRLLERWTHSDDYTEWTLFLHKDIKWGDGKPVTAHDVKFSLELITNPSLMYESRLFDEIAIVDSFTCQLRSKKPFTALTYRWYGICPSHLLGHLDPDNFFSWEFWKQPVGNGPYRYVRHIPDTMVELEINPDYYGPEPKIKRVVLKFGRNSITELLSGNVDAVQNLRPLEILQIKHDSRFNIYHEFDVTKVFSIIWNHRNPLFQDSSVRRALTHAINRRELTQVLSYPVDTPIFDVSFTPEMFYRGEIPLLFPYDLELSKRLLDEAGWLEQKKGWIREKNGQKFRFSLIFSEELLPGAIYIQDQFRRVGIDMKIVTMELSVHVGRLEEGKFDAIFRNVFPFDFAWASGGYVNPELERLQKIAYRSTSLKELESTLRKQWPIFQNDIPVTFLYPLVTFNVAQRRIWGLKSPHRSDPVKFIESLWIEEEEKK